MDHRLYIGKTLRELVSVTPDYAINFYQVHHKGKFHLRDHLQDDSVMDRIIKSISELYSDYHYDIQLK